MRFVFITVGVLSELLLFVIIRQLYKTKKQPNVSIARILNAAFVAVLSNVIIAVSHVWYINIFSFSMYFVSMDFITYFMLCFTYIYTNRLRHLDMFKKIWHFVILIDSVSLFVSIFTGHMYSMYSMEIRDGSTAYQTLPTLLFNVHLALCYLPVIIAIVFLTISLVNSQGFYRFKYIPVLASVFVIVLLNIAYMYFSLPFDYSVLFYALAGLLLFYFALYYVPRKLMSNTLQLAVDSMKEGLLLFDTDQNCIYINKTARDTFNISKESFGFDDYPVGLWIRGRDRKKIGEFEDTFSMYIGTVPSKVRVDYRKCIDSKNRSMGSFFLFENVTEDYSMMESLKEARAEANRANAAKSLFLANMSHEIRTPINSILGMNEMILRESTDSKVLEYADDIRSSGNTLLSLINNILDFSKIESGKMEIHPIPYSVHQLIRESYNLVAPRAMIKDLPIVVKCAPDIPGKLYGDSERIKQVLVNLLTNSIKYTRQGQVTLEAEWIFGKQLKFVVSDTGQGISAEDTGKLFKMFQRINEEKNRTIEGTGLGLAISRELLNMMQGTISVSSVSGQGSEFTVMIPQTVIDAEPMGEFKLQKEPVSTRATYKESFHAPDAKVLVVDDVDLNLKLVAALLKKTQISLSLVNDGNKAVELCKEEDFDLILMDHMMPPPDGIETTRMIRDAGGHNAGIPVIMLTANAIEGSEETYLEMGFDDYLSKPIHSNDLEDTLSRLLPKEKVIK
ncbi:MAG: response regulator [Lachnospiraceae bacterium]|nr:response regulator [Lachnospiraceae bacterium]